jgi:hypothetical protein
MIGKYVAVQSRCGLIFVGRFIGEEVRDKISYDVYMNGSFEQVKTPTRAIVLADVKLIWRKKACTLSAIATEGLADVDNFKVENRGITSILEPKNIIQITKEAQESIWSY